MLRCALLATLLISPHPAQDIASNPLLQATQSLGVNGLPTKAAPATSPAKFKREANSSTMDGLLKELLDTDEERKVVGEFTKAMITQFEDQAKGTAWSNDAAASTAFAMAIFVATITEKEVSDEGMQALTKQLQAAMDRPEIRDATDAQKQQMYELSLLTASISLIAATQAESPEGVKAAKQIATSMMRVLTGVTPDQIKVESGKVKITARPPVTVPKSDTPPAEAPATAGLAPGFTYAVPSGWVQRDGWLVREHVASRYENHREVTAAHVRILPAIPAEGNMGTAFDKLWKQYLPAEAAGKMSGMIYRRYVGDGILAQFVSGLVRDKGRDSDTAYTLMLLDCKTHWQPIVLAGSYDENSTFRTGIDQIARYTYGTSAEMAEELLKTIRCPSAKGSPLVTAQALAGEYHFGTGSTLWTENVYTGSTSMSYVSYGGTLTLKPNGTFVWKYRSATGRDGAMKAGGIDATGKWSIQGDILYLVYETYDQGDSYKAKDKRYKIAGLTTFSDGEKIAVLLDKWQSPVNLTTVGDRGDWYSTKKK